MGKFNVGDRVILIADNPDGNGELYAGEIGTVCDSYYPYSAGVRYDNRYASLHTCDDNCENGYGWYTPDKCLELYVEEETLENNITASDLSCMLGIGG